MRGGRLLIGGVLGAAALLAGEFLFLKKRYEKTLLMKEPLPTAPQHELTWPRLRRSLPPPDRLTAFLNQPIFFERRKLPTARPPKRNTSKTPTSSPPKPPPTVPLVAILDTPETGRMALFQGRPKPFWVRVGGEVEGWRVVTIASDRVVLERGGKRHELLLFKKRPQSPLQPFMPPSPSPPPPPEPPPEEPPET